MIEAMSYFFKNFVLLNGYFVYTLIISALSLGIAKKTNVLIILNIMLFMLLIYLGVKELIPLVLIMFMWYFYKNFFGDEEA